MKKLNNLWMNEVDQDREEVKGGKKEEASTHTLLEGVI